VEWSGKAGFAADLTGPRVLDSHATRLYSSAMLTHLTPTEAPVVWLAFAAGLAVGLTAAFLVRRRARDRVSH